MKFVRIALQGKATWGVIKGDTVFSLAEAPYESLSYDGNTYPLAQCKLLAPCEPTKIVCVGKNYYDHAVEMNEGIPDHPILFMKGPNALNCPNGQICAPAFVTRLDYEGELAIVIKKRAKNVTVDEYANYILGYTCLNDVTARDIQKGDGQWTRGKGMDGFAPVGPWVTDEVNPDALTVETRLNGTVVQHSNTELFMTKIPHIIAYITAAMTLEPGDVIATGTPAGIGPMQSGDMVEVEIEGIGILKNQVQ